MQRRCFRTCIFAATLMLSGVFHSGKLQANSIAGIQARLGERIFLDTRLSADGKISCATCHQSNRSFTDGLSVPKGAKGLIGTRNTPSLIGIVLQKSFFWDGRRDTIAAQVLDPFTNEAEHGLQSHAKLVAIVKKDLKYASQFKAAFPKNTSPVTAENIAAALVAYLTSLNATESAFERYKFSNDTTALTPLEQAGYRVFNEVKCNSCHLVEASAAPFTDNKFHSAGIGLDRVRAQLPVLTAAIEFGDAQVIGQAVAKNAELSELGRFLVTGDPKDIGKFRTPSLRNAKLTAPYMHDGSVATIEEAIDREIYYRALELGKPVQLSPIEKAALVAFLKTL